MGRMDRIGKGNTSVRQKGRTLTVRYHSTDVVTATPKTVTLNTGGWFTKSTKDRMNQASRQLDLGYSVRQKKGDWIVTDRRGKEHKMKGRKITFRR